MAKAKEAAAPVPQITGGEVSFKRSFQPDQYGNRGAEVKLLFVVPEGAEIGNFLDTVGQLALDKAMELTYGKKPGTVPKPEKTVEPKVETPAAGSKAALEAAQAAKLEGKETKKVTMPSISTGEERKDPAQTEAEDEWGAEPEKVEEVSDAAMKDACSKRNQVIKNPAAIKALIAKFVPFPKGCADIEQSKRADFLKQLAETK